MRELHGLDNNNNLTLKTPTHITLSPNCCIAPLLVNRSTCISRMQALVRPVIGFQTQFECPEIFEKHREGLINPFEIHSEDCPFGSHTDLTCIFSPSPPATSTAAASSSVRGHPAHSDSSDIQASGRSVAAAMSGCARISDAAADRASAHKTFLGVTAVPSRWLKMAFSSAACLATACALILLEMSCSSSCSKSWEAAAVSAVESRLLLNLDSSDEALRVQNNTTCMHHTSVIVQYRHILCKHVHAHGITDCL